MVVTEGRSILDQIAYGRLRFFQRRLPEIAEYSQLTWQEEAERFRQARRRAELELERCYERAERQVGRDIADIFAVHAMLMEDQDFEESVIEMIRERGATAEFAVLCTGDEVAAAFAGMDSAYMQARAADLRDISRRMVRGLLRWRPRNPLREGPAILVADEFLPSEVMELDTRKLLGLIALKGSVDSHTSLILQAYRIPAMAEVELSPCWDGHLALLDGAGQRLYMDPDGALLDSLRLRYQEGGKPAHILEEEPLSL